MASGCVAVKIFVLESRALGADHTAQAASGPPRLVVVEGPIQCHHV
jgi:hypothetical protein